MRTMCHRASPRSSCFTRSHLEANSAQRFNTTWEISPRPGLFTHHHHQEGPLMATPNPGCPLHPQS
jgi:hypothetical protein